MFRTNKEVWPGFSARFSGLCIPHLTFESLHHKSTGASTVFRRASLSSLILTFPLWSRLLLHAPELLLFSGSQMTASHGFGHHDPIRWLQVSRVFCQVLASSAFGGIVYLPRQSSRDNWQWLLKPGGASFPIWGEDRVCKWLLRCWTPPSGWPSLPLL